MPNSKRIGAIVGPTIVAMLVSEFPLVQPHLYDAQIPPVVYLSGTLMFVGGLAIVRAHNQWALDWIVLITLSGWFFLLLGLFRMSAAGLCQRDSVKRPRRHVACPLHSDRRTHDPPATLQ